MQLWLALDTPANTPAPAARPFACPYAGCGGRRFDPHQRVTRRSRGVTTREVEVGVQRLVCRRCQRTFRAYPRGIDRGRTPACAWRMALALRFLGLSYRDVSRALAVLGVALAKSQVHAVVAPRIRGLARRGMAPMLQRVEAGAAERAGGADDVDTSGAMTAPSSMAGAAFVWIDGRKLPLRRAVNRCGRAALVIDGIDRNVRHAVDAWMRDTLAGFGVHVEVVCPLPPRPRRRASALAAELSLPAQGDDGACEVLAIGAFDTEPAKASRTAGTRWASGEGGSTASRLDSARPVVLKANRRRLGPWPGIVARHASARNASNLHSTRRSAARVAQPQAKPARCAPPSRRQAKAVATPPGPRCGTSAPTGPFGSQPRFVEASHDLERCRVGHRRPGAGNPRCGAAVGDGAGHR